MTVSVPTRSRIRPILAAIGLLGLLIALTACDQEFDAKITANGKVSGTWILAETNAKIQSEATEDGKSFDDELAVYRSNMTTFITNSFSTVTVSDWADDEYSGVMGSFSGLSYGDFSDGVANAFTSTQAESDAKLVKVNDRYVFGVTNLQTDIYGNPDTDGFGGGAPIEFNSFKLTFPVPVKSANGKISGKTVTWNFVAHPGLTSLFADTGKATVPVKGAFKKSGKVKVGKTVTIKAPNAPGAKKAYKWYAGSKAVPGATGSKLKLTAALKGKVISVKVTYTKTDYYPFAKKVSFGKLK